MNKTNGSSQTTLNDQALIDTTQALVGAFAFSFIAIGFVLYTHIV